MDDRGRHAEGKEQIMAVLVTMQVGPVDWGKFGDAIAWAETLESPGMRWRKVHRSESDPKNVLILEEWDSHDAFHALSEKYGDEFNKRAGTEGLDWVSGVWTI
jgi:quinol monooxygenase YgiN